jgi:hypothetical protein
MAVIVKLHLPNSFLRLDDGTQWEPPPEVMKFLAWLFSLEEQEYVRVRMFLAPMRFLQTACNVAQNPLLSPLFQHMVESDYFAYRASYTPPPGSTKQ